ncbi:MAG: 1-acyl-sn-glycerol-3-phosphate acyltransferase [Bacteroidales bacterium]|nr:1-acyl-sn-glycerol-3-phosphate acyltransferase [Bacteroidales bacterium]
MLKLKNINKTGVGHKIARVVSDTVHNIFFYRKITVTGYENVEKNKPTLIGPNHQNALMDALAVFSINPKVYPVFLARSDIFFNDFVGNFLISMKILPVYRIRDGKEKLALNEKIFNVSVSILEDNKTLVVFPEAQHTPYRSLLQLKKGLMRIAFHTAEKHNFDIDLQIVPVGIYYKNYFNYRSDLLVNFGKPLKIKDYKQQYEENSQSALVALKKDMREAMIPLAIHIKNKEFYNEYEASRDIFDFYIANKENLNLKKQTDKFKADKKIISILDEYHDAEPEKFIDFSAKIKNYSLKLKNNNIKDYLFDQKPSFIKTFGIFLLTVILLPFNIIGFINFAVPLGLPEIFVKKFKDAQFHSSVRYVATMFIVPLWGIIGFSLLWIFTKIWWIGLAFFVIQTPFMSFWLEIRKLFKKTAGKLRFLFLNSTKKSELQQIRSEILAVFKNIS